MNAELLLVEDIYLLPKDNYRTMQFIRHTLCILFLLATRLNITIDPSADFNKLPQDEPVYDNEV